MPKIICILLITGLFSLQAATQEADTSSLFSLGIKAHRSFIIQHSSKLSDDVTSSNPWMIEAELNWHLRRQAIWNYCNCYPRTGISFGYTNFGRPDILGESIPIYAFIEPFILSERRLNYSIRFGIGPAYMTTVYNETKNPDNLFFSSRISFLVLLNATLNYRITPHFTIRAAGSYNHISNGGISEPNLGINFPSVSLGADFSFREIVLPHREYSPSGISTDRKNNFTIHAGITAKPTKAGAGEKRYPVYVLGLNYSHKLWRILALNAGGEWMNDRSIYRSVREIPLVKYPDHNRVGVLLGIDWIFGRFVFYQQLGIYVYSPLKALSPVYQRYGLNFRISQHVFVGINIKAHGQDADFMDLRAGFMIPSFFPIFAH